jgi:hypothetical protein
MPKPDEIVAEVGPFVIFKKSDSKEYEIVGPSAQNSPLAYTMIRVTPEVLQKLQNTVKADARRR